MSQAARQPWWFWWLGISAVAVCLGSVGPWASVLFITVSGVQAGDGWGTLAAGVVAAAAFVIYLRYTRRPRPAWPLGLILLAGVGAAVVGVWDWSDLERAANEAKNDEDNIFGATVSVGWGLVLVTIASFSLVGASLLTYRRRAREPVPFTPEVRDQREYRECPHCKETMRRDASVCPHCRHESAPWTLHEGYWWTQVAGEWYWLDERSNSWQRKQTPVTTTAFE